MSEESTSQRLSRTDAARFMLDRVELFDQELERLRRESVELDRLAKEAKARLDLANEAVIDTRERAERIAGYAASLVQGSAFAMRESINGGPPRIAIYQGGVRLASFEDDKIVIPTKCDGKLRG